MRARALIIVLWASGCANDPSYLDGPVTLDAGMDDGMGGITQDIAQLMLPIKTETSSDAAARMALATKLGVMVPYVRVDDLDIEVEYTIKNLDPMPGQVKIQLNGANEFFVYDPTMIILAPADNEAPPTPPLQGDIPIDVPAMGQVDGVFREDQLREAAVDCDQVTRGHVNPFAATLKIDKNDQMFQPLTTYVPPMVAGQDPPVQTPDGPPVPRDAMASLIRIDLVFKPDHHMTMDYVVRVRDHRGILHDKGLQAPMGEVVQFMPVVYAP